MASTRMVEVGTSHAQGVSYAPSSTVNIEVTGDEKELSAGTLDRVSYAHSPTPAQRFAASQAAARRRMSDANPASQGDAEPIVVPLRAEYAQMPLAPPPEGPVSAAEDVDAAQDSVQIDPARAARLARREERRAEKAAQRAQDEADALEALEISARRMYYGGFLALPMLWLVAIIYFRQEHKSEDGSPNIKWYYRYSLLMFIVSTAVFLAWFIAFQVKADSVFRPINILYSKFKSPNRI